MDIVGIFGMNVRFPNHLKGDDDGVVGNGNANANIYVGFVINSSGGANKPYFHSYTPFLVTVSMIAVCVPSLTSALVYWTHARQ